MSSRDDGAAHLSLQTPGDPATREANEGIELVSFLGSLLQCSCQGGSRPRVGVTLGPAPPDAGSVTIRTGDHHCFAPSRLITALRCWRRGLPLTVTRMMRRLWVLDHEPAAQASNGVEPRPAPLDAGLPWGTGRRLPEGSSLRPIWERCRSRGLREPEGCITAEAVPTVWVAACQEPQARSPKRGRHLRTESRELRADSPREAEECLVSYWRATSVLIMETGLST